MPQLDWQRVYDTFGSGCNVIPMDLADGRHGKLDHEQHYIEFQLYV